MCAREPTLHLVQVTVDKSVSAKDVDMSDFWAQRQILHSILYAVSSK